MLELYVCTAYKTVEQGLLAYKRLARGQKKKKKNISDCNLYNTDKGFGVVYKRLPLSQNVELKRSKQTGTNWPEEATEIVILILDNKKYVTYITNNEIQICSEK